MEEKDLELAESLRTADVDLGLQKVRAEQQTKPEDFDGYCTCGDEIPKGRIDLGYYNCIVCQGKREERRRVPRPPRQKLADD